MLDDFDVPWHRHAKAAVGGVAAAAIGDPAVFVSVDAMHQGPQGGGPCIAIVDAGSSVTAGFGAESRPAGLGARSARAWPG